MIALDEVTVIVGELAGFCDARIGRDEREAMARRFQAALRDVHPDAAREAFGRWLDAQNPNPAHPPNLPIPRTIVGIAHEIQAEWGRGSRGPERTAEPFQRPRPEFVKAHLDGQRRIAALFAGVLDRHDHRNGRDACPICGPAGDSRRARASAILADLPAPVEPLSKCRRRCRGGWLTAPDGVHPCPTCSPTTHGTWQQGTACA